MPDFRVDESANGLVWVNGRCAGQRCGTLRSDGYRSISVDGKNQLEHRLVWFLSHGEWPTLHVDHINGIRDDNRPCNLRLATRSQNQANRSHTKVSSSGLKGAYWHKRDRRWWSKIQVAGRQIVLGTFESAEAANAAYTEAAVAAFGEFARV